MAIQVMKINRDTVRSFMHIFSVNASVCIHRNKLYYDVSIMMNTGCTP